MLEISRLCGQMNRLANIWRLRNARTLTIAKVKKRLLFDNQLKCNVIYENGMELHPELTSWRGIKVVVESI